MTVRSQNKDLSCSHKILFIDDEIAGNESDREDIILDLGIPEECVMFAGSFDEASKLIKEVTDIQAFFLDLKIPKTNGRYDIDPPNIEREVEWGFSLIPLINQYHKFSKILIYSCYVKKSYLVDNTNSYNNIAGLYGKTEGVVHRKQLLEEIFLRHEKNITAITTIEQGELEAVEEVKQLEIKSVAFDYSSLNEKDARWIKDRTDKINNLLRRTAQDTLDIGRYITEVKASLEFGQYEQWVETSLPISLVSAYRYMLVYERLKNIGLEDVSEMDISPTALYEITALKMPDNAILEMRSIAESGVRIDSTIANQLKQKYAKTEKSGLREQDNLEEKKSNQDFESKPERTRAVVDKQNLPVLQPPLVRKQKIVGVVRRQNFWDLEGKHQIFRTEPNSDKFINALPNKIALYLGFPPDTNWSWNFKKYNSYMLFYTNYSDADPECILEAIKKIIEATTNAGDEIAICYAPNPKILPLISSLGCKAYIADPDYENCMALAESFLAVAD